MDKIITHLPKKEVIPKYLRVAAYTRVSSGKDEALHSLGSQISYYNQYISTHKDWIFVGIYSDGGRSGTQDKRNGFQEMLKACREGKIDLIVTKSVSRFARNVELLLKTVRDLTSLGVDIYFEEQKIHSISKDGEFMLTVVALYAEMEAKSASNNMLWKVHKKFEEGKLYSMTVLGYRLENGKLVIEPHEAEAVRLMFKMYLQGYGMVKICHYLNEHGYRTRYGNKFYHPNVLKILSNYIYTGDVILQRTYKPYGEKKCVVNKGEKTRYFIEDAHEPIIDKETFNKVQEQLEKRKRNISSIKQEHHPFDKMLVCSICGHHYSWHKNHKPCYVCCTSHTYGQKACASKGLQEDALRRVTSKVLGIKEFDESLMRERINEIVVQPNGDVLFKMKDGREILKECKPLSRKHSWTKEMREQARARALAREEAKRHE